MFFIFAASENKIVNIMKTEHFKRKAFIILTLPFLLWACNKDESSFELEVLTDAYIIRKMIDGEPKSALAFYAYANTSIASATVTPPSGESGSFELSRGEESSSTFYREPKPGEYNAAWPAVGNYNFTVVTTGGETVEQTDAVEIANLAIPVITSATFHASNATLTLKWEPVQGVNGYVIKLLNAQGKTVFMSFALTAANKEFNINSSSGNWFNQVYTGDELKLQLHAFAFESGTAAETAMYNISEIAIAEKDITWGN
jgi:hypothetical protein